MAYDTLKGLIRQYIKTNGQNEITGQILQNVLIAMVDEYPSLTGYATQQWVQSQGYMTEADLSNYATQTWVEAQLLGYLPTSTAIINNVVQSADGSLKLSGRNFADTYLDFTHTHRFEELTDLPTTLQDYGITDVYILNGTIYLGGVTITPLTSETDPTVPAWAKASAKPSYTLDEVPDGSTRKLANYLPLSGDVMAGNIYFPADYGVIFDTDSSIKVSDSDSFLYINGYLATVFGINDGTNVTERMRLTASGLQVINGLGVGTAPANGYAIDADGAIRGTSMYVYTNAVRHAGDTYISNGTIYIGGSAITPITSLSGYATESWVSQNYLPTSTSLINAVVQSADGSIKFSGRNFADTYLDFTHTHRFEELTDLPTLLQDFGITGGTLSDLTVNNATVNNTLVITNGNDYVSIAGEGITIVDEDAGVFNIYMSSAGYMAVDTSIVASSFVKSGGTSSQFLKADGSVDSNAYITSAALTGYATQSWVQQQGYLTSSSLSGYATQSWVSQNYLPTSTVLVNTLAKSADGSMKFSGRNFADTYVDFSHDHRWEEIVDRPNIEIGGYGMIYTDGKFGVGIKVPSYAIDVDGSVRATSFVNSSDARLKDIEDYNADISAEAVAMAPAVHYQWKNRKDKTAMVGSIAQYWQNLIPEAVSTDDKGYLSMQYDVIALISAISIAKRTVEHEQRIAELESENAQLRLELNSVKEAIKTT